jgi:RNA polymerase sigma-70 factor (ECF subfamily)
MNALSSLSDDSAFDSLLLFTYPLHKSVPRRCHSTERVNSKLKPQDIRQLYEQHRRGLLAYACSFLSSFTAAEDALHQVFERLLRGDVEISGEPAPYLYRAVRNTSLNLIRSRTREVELDDAWLESPVGMEGVGVELQSALRELPEEQREVILLHIWGQMSFEATAAALGISPNTAASRYRYGLMKLREQFKVTAKDRYGLAR